MRTVAHSLACFLLVATVSRASWLMKGKPPEVLVTNVTSLEGTAVEQQLQGDLRIRNPNEFDLFVTGIDLTFNLNGIRLARGLDNTTITVPRLSSDKHLDLRCGTPAIELVPDARPLVRHHGPVPP